MGLRVRVWMWACLDVSLELIFIRDRVCCCHIRVSVSAPSVVPGFPHYQAHSFAYIIRTLAPDIVRDSVHEVLAVLTAVVGGVVLVAAFISCMWQGACHVHGFVKNGAHLGLPASHIVGLIWR